MINTMFCFDPFQNFWRDIMTKLYFLGVMFWINGLKLSSYILMEK